MHIVCMANGYITQLFDFYRVERIFFRVKKVVSYDRNPVVFRNILVQYKIQLIVLFDSFGFYIQLDFK